MRCESVKLPSKCINCVKFCILLQRIYATMGKNSDSGAGKFECICLRKKGKATRGGCNYCGSGYPGRRRHGSARWKSPINSSPPLFPQSPRVFILSVQLLLFTLWADPKDPVNTYFFRNLHILWFKRSGSLIHMGNQPFPFLPSNPVKIALGWISSK